MQRSGDSDEGIGGKTKREREEKGALVARGGKLRGEGRVTLSLEVIGSGRPDCCRLSEGGKDAGCFVLKWRLGWG